MKFQVRKWTSADGLRGTNGLMWCPGCDDLHGVELDPLPTSWYWDGDAERPTISPSILVQGIQWPAGSNFHRPNHQVAPSQPTRCHSFIIEGRWQFLNDCTHSLAGQTVEMVDLPEWLTQ